MPVLRPAGGALTAALAAGNIAYMADLFTFTILSGHVYRFTSFDTQLLVAGNLYGPCLPWLSRGPWRVTNTMEVPTLEVYLQDNRLTSFSTGGFGGGAANIKGQIQNGLLDGAAFTLSRVFMPTAGDTTTYGTVDLFFGVVGQINILGGKCTIKIKGKNNLLASMAPRDVYQPSCRHTFCDSGCGLSPVPFTANHTVQASPSPTPSVFGWTGGGTFALAKGGTVTFIGGVLQGETRGVIDATATALTFTIPFTQAPGIGDTFSLFQACDKTLNTCNVTFNNLINYGGFPYIPPPASTAVGQ